MLSADERARLQLKFTTEFIDLLEIENLKKFATKEVTKILDNMSHEVFVDFVQKTTNYTIIPKQLH